MNSVAKPYNKVVDDLHHVYNKLYIKIHRINRLYFIEGVISFLSEAISPSQLTETH